MPRESSNHATAGVSYSGILRHRHLGNPSCDKFRKAGTPSQLSRAVSQRNIAAEAAAQTREGASKEQAASLHAPDAAGACKEAAASAGAAAETAAAAAAATPSFKVQQIPGHTRAPPHRVTTPPTANPLGRASVARSNAQSGGRGEASEMVERAACKSEACKRRVKGMQGECKEAKETEREKRAGRGSESERVGVGDRTAKPNASVSFDRLVAVNPIKPLNLEIVQDARRKEERQKLAEECAESERHKTLHEECIQQLRFEQEEKLERAASNRKALQELRGENSLI